MNKEQIGMIADYESRTTKAIYNNIIDDNDVMMTDEALLEAEGEFDNHDCHASPEDGCLVCQERCHGK